MHLYEYWCLIHTSRHGHTDYDTTSLPTLPYNHASVTVMSYRITLSCIANLYNPFSHLMQTLALIIPHTRFGIRSLYCQESPALFPTHSHFYHSSWQSPLPHYASLYLPPSLQVQHDWGKKSQREQQQSVRALREMIALLRHSDLSKFLPQVTPYKLYHKPSNVLNNHLLFYR